MLTDEDFPTERKKVFLDLDNTVISSVPTKDFSLSNPAMKDRAMALDFHNMDDYYIIFERPGLQEFLDYLFENFDVNIWSAASKDYVAFIAKNIIMKDKPERKLGYILFSYQCDLSRKEYDNGIKDLRLVWDVLGNHGFSPENTVIVDDLKKVKKINGDNCLAIVGFEFTKNGSENDQDLTRIKEKLEEFKKTGVSSSSMMKSPETKKMKEDDKEDHEEDDEDDEDDEDKEEDHEEEDEEDHEDEDKDEEDD